MSVGVYNIPFITDILLDALLKELQTGRKVVITIKNFTSQTLEKPRVYYVSGTSQFGLPTPPVSMGRGLVWGAPFMWSVPLVYLFYSNWWNLKVYEGLIEPDEDLFWKMYYDNPNQGNGNPFSGKLSGGWSYEGSMGDAGQSTVVINFQDSKS
ncbi:DELTA-actitoxin-Ate1a isoform X2 [Rhizophagus irregularis DAOM 181602=DAOM 197198]|nr:DELTA-actitoxin-Ate1a isoform X2 [Rhizophagus irregularis DAOM 181602=DAOM 197198]